LPEALSPALLAATSALFTTPGYLVEIVWSSTVSRFSSRADQTFGGYLWLGGRLGKVRLDENGGGGSVELMNGDLLASALALNESAGRPCRVWKFYTDNPAGGDAVQVFDGVTDEMDFSNYDRARIALVDEPLARARTISPATGFNHLMPEGSTLTWGGQTIRLERG
jgi:hypothetical protein